ncbi:hypothetical protein H0H87_011456 [Tephrocybe sp. NHM501043]|nr:hypothetical protein H0H87_011456 [Tephrocybe sp. NHM501043]
MSQYKSALRQQLPADSQENSKYRNQAQQLQELFPNWTNDDLQSLLVEVHGDVELAATRISEGTAEQWGSVSRKKDKKAPASAPASKETFTPRGDSRGARGGRGGRGGPGRGGAAMRGRGGPPRGGAVNGRSPRVDSPNPTQADGVTAAPSAAKDAPDAADASADPVVPEPAIQQNGTAPSAGWGDSSSSQATPSVSTSTSRAGASTTSTWGADTEPNGSTPSVHAVPSKPVSNPATSKKSWAQIARPQEKPAPPPPAIVPAPVPAPSAPVSQPPAPEPEPEPQTQTWEEPTTAQAPTWEDEPQPKPAATATETWPAASEAEEPKVEQTQKHEAEAEASKEPTPAEPEKQQIPTSKSEPAPLAPVVTPVLAQTAPAATPSPKLASRPAATAHRSSARYKMIDQPVVMPSSFGSGIEKVGMQFGSLSLGGESIFDSNPTEPEAPAPAPEAPVQSAAPAPAPAPAPSSQETSAPAPPATAPAPATVGNTIFSQQQTQPPAIPQQLHTLPTNHSNYFGGRAEAAGGAAAPYFHTPTPPATQGHDSPYGSFGQLGGQPQHQQASHLGGFGAQDYNNYGDNQRGFYDSYQQGAFGNRNVLGHEDVKGLPVNQQQAPANAGIPPSNPQSAQPHGSLQAGGAPPPAGAQAPQQSYPVPYPYYTYPQSQQFYSYNPSYGAVPQPFKYPAMYQPPAGPASAPSPVGKQPGAGVGGLPQGNPYSQGLYPQGGYDDYSHPHHSQHSQQHSHSLGLNQGGVGAGEYGKQLYGGGSQGMQGFMGTSGAGGPASNAGGPRGGGSPETPYKPYAAKDVGGGAAGRGAGQQGQGQAQPQGQGHAGQVPQGQGFYGGARFGGAGAAVGGAAGVGGAGGGPQQSGHHPQNGPGGHLYPQSGNEGNFYPYRGQQQGYWQ